MLEPRIYRTRPRAQPPRAAAWATRTITISKSRATRASAKSSSSSFWTISSKIRGKRASARLRGSRRKRALRAERAYNYGFFSAGSLTKLIDPYFRFQSALGRWGRSFMNLGIRYNGSELTSGSAFAHRQVRKRLHARPLSRDMWIRRAASTFRPGSTSLRSGTPGQMGSGYAELNTFFTKGAMRPTSAIFLCRPRVSRRSSRPLPWRLRRRNRCSATAWWAMPTGVPAMPRTVRAKPMPLAIIRQGIELKHKYLANRIRQMLVVPYVERTIYEMPEEQLTPRKSSVKGCAKSSARSYSERKPAAHALHAAPALGRKLRLLPWLRTGRDGRPSDTRVLPQARRASDGQSARSGPIWRSTTGSPATVADFPGAGAEI